MSARRPVALAAAVILAACAKPETAEQAAARMQSESDSARAAIEATLANFARWFEARAADSLRSVYTADAHVMPPNMPAAHGHEGLRLMFADSAMMGTITFRVENVVANGPMAVDRGRWAWTPPAGAPIPADSGKYLARWQRQADGSWRMVEDIWNSDVAAAPPPPAPRRR